MSSSNNGNEEEKSFSCRIEDMRILGDLIGCLYTDISKDTECAIEATPDNICFKVSGKGRSCQGRATLSSGLFDEYICTADSIVFSVGLFVLVDCLKLFGGSAETTTATLSYSSNDAVFKISLEETGMISVCDITTLYSDEDEMEDSLLAAFRNSSEQCQVIIKSDALREGMQELTESLWLHSVEFTVSNDPAGLTIATGGSVGSSEIVFPRSSEVFGTFRCVNEINEVYPLKALLLAMKALSIANESYLRINGDGLLCLQHQVESSRGGECFVDFIVISEERLDD